MLTPASAQNYRVLTDSIFNTYISVQNETSEPVYRNCFRHLKDYIRSNYGGQEGWTIMSGNAQQISAPVSGDDDKLRQVTSYIIDQLSRYPYLQQYSERIDDGHSLRGRYIIKLSPEESDTSAYVFLKYDRKLLVLRHSWNQSLRMPTNGASSKTNPADEELSLWRKLRDDFYFTTMNGKKNVDIKYLFRTYRTGGKGFYITNPAPDEEQKTKMELVRIDDIDSTFFYKICKDIELAGREEGTIIGQKKHDSWFTQSTNNSSLHHYACHTFPNGLSEFIGIVYEDSVSFLIRATSEQRGLIVNSWGKTNWMSENEINAMVLKENCYLGVWVYDAVTKKSMNNAKVTTLDDEGNVIDHREPIIETPWKGKSYYRYFCFVPRRSHYKFKVEAEGYETVYVEMILKEDETQKQIEVFLKPKAKK